MKDHTIVCGFGTKGRSAVQAMTAAGIEHEQTVVVDPAESGVAAAAQHGLVAVTGNATSVETLEQAGIRTASSVVVAVNRDDTDVAERGVAPAEVGRLPAVMQRQPVLAVVRDGAVHLYSDDEVQQLRDGDRLVYVKSSPATT